MRVPDAVVAPSRLVAANAVDASEHGARVRTHAPVTSMTVEDDRATAVTLGGDAGETLRPRYVVNATGPHAGRVAEMAGVSVSMRPTRGVMVSVEYDGLEPVVNRCREPDDGDIVVPHDGEVVLGTTSVPVDDPDDYERADWEIERTVEVRGDAPVSRRERARSNVVGRPPAVRTRRGRSRRPRHLEGSTCSNTPTRTLKTAVASSAGN